MATPSNLDSYDRNARIQELYLALNSNDATASQEAMRELSGLGFTVEQDPTGSSYVISTGKNSLLRPQQATPADGGSLAQRPAIPTGMASKAPASGYPRWGSGSWGELGSTPADGGSLAQRPAIPTGMASKAPAPAPGYLSWGSMPKPQIARNVADAATRAAVLAASTNPAAPTAPTTPGVVAAVPAGRSAFSMGAPAMDDRVDGSGRSIPGTQTFVRNLFATADNANKALAMYKKQNPNANSQNDPQHRALEQAVSSAVNDSNAGSKWASMTPSARQSVLTQGELASGRAKAVDRTQQGALELQNAESDRAKAGLPSNLLEDGQYFRDTGVMRGGAGVGTSTTRAGGVISPDSTTGGLALESPYGKGSAVFLNPHEQARRPEAKIEGMPASQYFDKAAMRQGRTFDVGDKHYSPELSPEDFKQKQLDEAKRKAEEARKKFAASILKR